MKNKVLLIKHYNEPCVLYESMTYLKEFVNVFVLHAADTPIQFVKSGEKSILAEINNLKIAPYKEINEECLAKVIEYDLLRNSSDKHNLLKQNARIYLAYAYYFLLKENINYLIVWNGMPLLGTCFLYIANKLNITTIFCENGPLPNTIAIDTVGINYKCSLSSYYKNDLSNLINNLKPSIQCKHIKEKYNLKKTEKSKVNRDIVKQLLYLKHCFKYNKKFPEICVNNQFKSACLKRINKFLYQRYVTSPPNEQYIFFPFQVYDDTQILIYSKLMKMEEVVWFLINQIQIYNKNKKCHLRLVIKQHPADIGRKNYINLFRKLKKDYKELVYIVDGSIESIIPKALCTVTINSSVGFESLVLGTPVITLGKAFYNYKLLVEVWEEHTDFQHCLESVIKNDFDKDLTRKYISYFYEQMLIQREAELVANKLIYHLNRGG